VIDGMIGAVLEGAEYQWLDCDEDFAPIPGATEQTYLPDESGNYAVEITTNGMCVDTSDCYFVIPTGMREVNPGNVEIYPNPARELLNVDLHYYVHGYLKLIDFTGRVVMESKFHGSKYSLDISRWPAGIYYLQVHTDHETIHRKIIKK
jgi:hypothetical protein